MKMYERLIPEWQHALNQFCFIENIKPWVLQNDSTSSKYVKLRECFYAYCVSIGLPPKDMATATSKSIKSVYYTLNKDGFRDLTKLY